MLKRLGTKQCRIGTKIGFDIPARKIAEGRDRIVRSHRRAYEQDFADRYTVVLDEVTVFRQIRRRFASRQLLERTQPEYASTPWEPTREQRGDGGNIRFADLTTAESRNGGDPLVDRGRRCLETALTAGDSAALVGARTDGAT